MGESFPLTNSYFSRLLKPPTSNHFSRILTNNYTNIDPVVDYFVGFWGHGMSMGILHSFLVYYHHSMGVSTCFFITNLMVDSPPKKSEVTYIALLSACASCSRCEVLEFTRKLVTEWGYAGIIHEISCGFHWDPDV